MSGKFKAAQAADGAGTLPVGFQGRSALAVGDNLGAERNSSTAKMKFLPQSAHGLRRERAERPRPGRGVLSSPAAKRMNMEKKASRKKLEKAGPPKSIRSPEGGPSSVSEGRQLFGESAAPFRGLGPAPPDRGRSVRNFIPLLSGFLRGRRSPTAKGSAPLESARATALNPRPASRALRAADMRRAARKQFYHFDRQGF